MSESFQFSPEDQEEGMLAFLATGGSIAEANGISEGILNATYSMAYSQYSSGHYYEAAKVFQYLCLFDQWNPRNFVGLGACQEMVQLFDQAVSTFSYAIELDRTAPHPYLYKAKCLLALGRNKEAEESLKIGLKFAEALDVNDKETQKAKTFLAVIKDNERRR